MIKFTTKLYYIAQVFIITTILSLLRAENLSSNNQNHERKLRKADYVEYPQLRPQPQPLPFNPSVMEKGMLLPAFSSPIQESDDVKLNLLSLNSSYSYDPNWPILGNIQLGQVAAVCINNDGNIAIFHRADRVWNAESFKVGTNIFAHQNLDPIPENTILLFDRSTGKLLKGWGSKFYYLPHGLYIDDNNNAWTTDTALHQVMKFDLNKSYDEPAMVLGKKFVPGKGHDTLFCKPTSVAVLANGDFFVADGYCNSRIVKFSQSGEMILEWGRNSFQGAAHPVAPPGFFAVPHALRLIKEKNLLCVADRENGRVQCFQSSNGTFHSQFHSPVIGSRIFSLDYASNLLGKLNLYVLNGPEVVKNDPNVYHEIKGFVLDMENEKILSKFGPNGNAFSNPHDLAVMHDGSELYVAELQPAKVYRFVANYVAKVASQQPMSMNKPTETLDTINIMTTPLKPEPGTTAILVVALVVLVAILFFGLALLISKRKKRGCLPFDKRNRRHAWDFPTVKSDSFKLGSILDRKRGFEKLDQEASDEEPNVTTNMLSSNAQFA